ncbi:GIN domain-containing protein [Flavobacterium sp. 14A]|uniref:GIN domain-containing protein n=1 Tax=Flavobacterium sp. 14A TaxID=2735896 RepID=UPI00156D4ACF|nr:DUF2807 domain-containing protein [Flavobacterium sp. 14A]NRT11071.1 hypothetical protein [Flavobacterium sp. 14A]
MKNFTVALFLCFISFTASAQKSEKIKGSRKVTTETRNSYAFNLLEVDDNLEVYLQLGDNTAIKVEADDNLQDVIEITSNGKALHIHTTKDVTRYKKMIVRITYTSELNKIISRGKSEINVIQGITVDTLDVRTYDKSKMFMNATVSNFSLEGDDKSTTELNLKAMNSKIVMSKDSEIKALVTATDLTCDLYQNASAKIEGDAANGTIRVDNGSKLTADKLNIKKLTILSEGTSQAAVNAVESVVIEAYNKSEIDLYGNAKIDLRNLTEEAKLFKKIK